MTDVGRDEPGQPRPEPASRAVFVFVVAFFVLMLVVTSGMTAIGVQQLFAQRERLNTWPSVTGTITAVDVESRVTTTGGPGSAGTGGTTSRSYRPVLDRLYTVSGVEHAASRALPMEGTGGESTWAHDLARRYKPGDTVPVYYNPADAADSFVIRYWDDALLLVAAFGGFVPLFLAVILTAGAERRHAIKWMLVGAAALVFVIGISVSSATYFAVVPLADQTPRARAVFLVGTVIAVGGGVLAWHWRRRWLATAG